MDLIGYSLGRYHILEQLGEGGMATVYKAYDTRLERDVAIKIIRVDQSAPATLEGILKHFEREAKSLARLTHPNIVHINDYGEQDGIPYLVMDYLPGGTLKQRLGKPMPGQEALRLLIPVAQALEYAHEQNIVHRDVKPSNILLPKGGQPMLTDFGIARLLEVEEGATLTGTGMGVGTPEYMAPEQWTGKTTHQSDIYSLGVVLYEMLTGRKPYTADTPAAVLIKQASDPLPGPGLLTPGLPDALEKLLLKALAKKPEDRYATMEKFAAAMENLAAGVSARPVEMRVQAQPEKSVTVSAPKAAAPVKAETRPIGKPRRTWLILLGAAALAVMGFGYYFSLPVEKRFLNSNLPREESLPAAIAGAQISPQDGMTMLLVPAGEFTMGSNGGSSDESPAHTVTLDAFYIDQTEVTNGMYAKCVQAGGCTPPNDSSSDTRTRYYGNQGYVDYPVIYVDWNQANAYCAWAGRRLPTEAEWEKAARGTDGRSYPWGNNSPDSTLANYDGNVGDTTRVGDNHSNVVFYRSGVSPYGAYDMAGNVWEWVDDWYAAYPGNTVSDTSFGTTYRVLRGGSWYANADYLRPSFRLKGTPVNWFSYVGFRCAR